MFPANSQAMPHRKLLRESLHADTPTHIDCIECKSSDPKLESLTRDSAFPISLFPLAMCHQLERHSPAANLLCLLASLQLLFARSQELFRIQVVDAVLLR